MKISSFFSGFVALVLFAQGCSADKTKDESGPDPIVPTERTMIFKVAYTLTGNTDDISFSWANGDSEKLGIVGATSGKVVHSTNLSIEDAQAAFTGDISVDDASVYCFYPTSSNASLTFAAFPFAASRTQTNAGDELTGVQLPLISDAVSIPEEGESVSVTAHAIPTILRLAIFSSDEELQSELVKGVSLQTEEKINGTYTWNFSLKTGSVTDGTGVSSVSLSNPYNLSGVGSASDAKSIYLIVAPVAVKSGYKYTISTDKATYIYPVDAAGEFGQGKILDVSLDLKSAERQEKGIITFDAAGLSGYECEANGSASATDIGSFSALVSGVPSTDYAADFYKKLTFQIKDSDGNAANWATPTLGDNGHINLTWEQNPAGKERTATVTANFTLTDDSYWYGGNPAFTFEVTQKPTVAVYDMSNIKNYTSWRCTAEGLAERDLGWYFVKVNGAAENAPLDDLIFHNFRCEVKDADTGEDITWAKAYCKANNNHVFISCDANPDAADRVAVITVNNLFGGEKLMEISISQHGTATPSVITYKVTASQYTFPAAGETDKDPNWYYLAYVDGNAGQEVVSTKYYDLKFEVVDDAGQPVTWVRVRRKAGDSNHVLLTCEANPGGLRRAYIRGTYEGDQYAVADKNPVLNVPVMQGPASGDYVIYTCSIQSYAARQSGYADVSMGTYSPFTNGNSKNDYDVSNKTVYGENYDIALTVEPADATWLTVSTSYGSPTNATWNQLRCKMDKNATGAVREVTVTATSKPRDGVSTFTPIFSFQIVQAAQ